MKAKPKAKPSASGKPKKPSASGKPRVSSRKAAAAMIPLALATILPPALDRANRRGAAPPTEAATAAVLFKPGCKFPFDSIKSTGLAIDAKCTSDGNGGDDMAKVLENHAKNNFCATGEPVPITYDDLKNLQKFADDNGLKKGLKTSRDSLIDIFDSAAGDRIGEGKLVQLVTFLLKAHHSNVGKGKGENVNCKMTEKDDNDIHIELTMDRSVEEPDPCDSVTAEMSPHFRPEEWNKLVDLDKFDRPVRITGPLFYDNSHAPCHDGVRPNPKRISVWEIHPVYQFEICKAKAKDLKACDVKDNSVWVRLDEWFTGDEEEEPGE